jgi:NADH:ubiquinone oxidoreductase subunit 5 (subunit L)/multisubunit Na+/H+ antiporter MnhA subunit
MEGPTPVSALIHAATMVTAGVFLLLRTHSIWNGSFLVIFIIAILGSITAFFGATVGLVQNDIKKVIAYSTCSQLGYMVFAAGIGAYNISLFHLFNHAFFKALLFLSAGSIIHSIVEEQDLRKMGSVILQLPITYMGILIGSLALMGVPFLTGFYSKDVIIEIAYASFCLEGTISH